MWIKGEGKVLVGDFISPNIVQQPFAEGYKLYA
jgi:hypothetical protein